MMGHKICLFGEIPKIISELYLLLLLIWSSAERLIRRASEDNSKIFFFSVEIYGML